MNQHQLPRDNLETSPERPNEKLSPVFKIRAVVDQVVDQYQKAIAGEDHTLGLSTGIRHLVILKARDAHKLPCGPTGADPPRFRQDAIPGRK